MQSEEPADWLELFLTDQIMSEIVRQTNIYASNSMTLAEMTAAQRRKAWKDVTLSELKDFFGLIFLTGLIHKPELSDYWTTDEALATPYFGKVMSRNRFKAILRYLHCNDSQDADDRMWKVRPILNYLAAKWKEMYQPSQNISIDEGTLLFRGRLSFRTYNPNKPCRYGIRSFILACSETAYCHSLQPYCGEYSSLLDTVTGLLGDLAGHGYILFMDNFYNSVALSEHLLELKTHTCGTIRGNRGPPPKSSRLLLPP